jgi:hypothetical protein
MCKDLRRISLVLVGVAWFALVAPASGVIIFDNATNDLSVRFDPGTNEVGDEIILAGSARYLTYFSFEFYAINTNHPATLGGTVNGRVRFYENDGPSFNGYLTPGTVFYDSGWFSVSDLLGGATTPRSTIYFSTADFGGAPLYIPIPGSNMTWSVQFQESDPTDDVGLDLYSPPVVGQDYPDYWMNLNNSGSWALKSNTVPVDFAALMLANAAPLINIKKAVTNSVVVYWPSAAAGYTLQTNSDLRTTNWGYFTSVTPADDGTNKSVTFPMPTGNMFYRLSQ